jgi:hypothetical protein
MKPKVSKILLVILIIIGTHGCANLKQVNDFSSSAVISLGNYDKIEYGFKQSCLDKCRENKINDLKLNLSECDCAKDKKADSVTFIIYSAIKGYFAGLTNLSSDELVNYKFDDLSKSLEADELGSIKLNDKEAAAFSKISSILFRAFTDEYRKSKIKEYIREANEPIKNLLYYLDFNLSSNLMGKLEIQKQRIEMTYFDLTKDASLSTYEKRQVVREYFNTVESIGKTQEKIAAYSKGLKKIAEGHQKLYDNLSDLSVDELKNQLIRYGSDIKDIVSEFNKIGR